MAIPAEKVKLIECPRDAMQGLHDFIPTENKIRYINRLLKAGFHTVDFGSFVSPAAIPQLRDSAEVVQQLTFDHNITSLLAIIANVRGAQQALLFPQISYLGFPLSLSETFQLRNTNKSIREAFAEVGEIQRLCIDSGKTLVVYLSMGFGNPYGEDYETGYLQDFVGKLDVLGIRIICPSDTIGVSNPENIEFLFNALIPGFPHIEFGAHLHSHPSTAMEKIDAAYFSGCRRFDGAMKGWGGCPMAEDELVGNIAMENLISFFLKKNINTGINMEAFEKAYLMASEVFPA
jgi:hydroxymethylglutaryl-CoA lyase